MLSVFRYYGLPYRTLQLKLRILRAFAVERSELQADRRNRLKGAEVESQGQTQGATAVGLHPMTQVRGEEKEQPGLRCYAGREQAVPEDEVSRPLRGAEVVDP